MSAERDLLLGVLALQLNFIDRAGLLAAFDRWSADKSQPLDQHLQDLGFLTPARRELLLALADEHVVLHAGDVERSLTAIATNEVDFDLATDLSQRVGDSTTLSLRKGTAARDLPTTVPHRGSSEGARSDGGRSETGRFQILRPHAEGGLGRVSVALDTELHREVAFKEIKQQRADDRDSRARFVLEAEITGGLEHPGIVPIYGLGTHKDGRPFYAMRFIRGDDLRTSIQRLHEGAPVPSSLELRKLMARFLDVCRAIHYAHCRGVLHRDIKPGNVMLGRHGETLVVDWGLAKLIGRGEATLGDNPEATLCPPSASSSESTVMGAAVGTPAYMSPEQAEGQLDALSRASDVFSLGATLYELLTGQRPFSGKNAEEILRRVRREEFQRPRKVKGWIPKPLEAICLRAMAHQPADRYASAELLAADLEAWLADEPVTAWREPAVVRARRWVRRHQATVSTALAVLVLAAISAGLVAWQQHAHALAIGQKNIELAAQRQKAEGREQMAIDAVMKFRDAVAENPDLKGNPALDKLRKLLLREPLKFFERLREELQRDPDTRPESLNRLANASRELAMLTNEIGNQQQALQAFEESRKILERLVRQNPTVTEFQSNLAQSQNGRGVLLSATGRPIEALAAFDEALRIVKRLARENATATAFQGDLARSYNNIGNLLGTTGQPAKALKAYEQALEIQQRLAKKNPTVVEFQSSLAASLNNVGLSLKEIGRTNEALAAFERSLKIWQRLVRENPEVADFQNRQARSQLNLGMLFIQIGQPAEALNAYQQALEIQERLAREHPTVTEFQSGLANSHHVFGNLLRETGKPTEALEAFQRSLEIQQRLARENPTVIEFQNNLAASHNNLGSLLSQTGNLAEAMAAYQQELETLERLARQNPTLTTVQSNLASSHFNLGNLLGKMGRPADALAAYERALEIQERLARGNPTVTQFQRDIAATHNGRGNLLQATGMPDEALVAYQQALQIRATLARENPTVIEFQNDLAESHNNIGVLLVATGRLAEAPQEYHQALEILSRLVRENPTVTKFQQTLAATHWNLGVFLAGTGKLTEGLAEYQQSVEIRIRLAQDNPTVTEYQDELAICQNELGLLFSDSARPNEARLAYQQALEIRERLAREHPESAEFASGVGATLNNLAKLDLDAGRFDVARDRLREAIQCQARALAAQPENPQYRQFLGIHYSNLLRAAVGLNDSILATEVRTGIATLAASDPRAEALDQRIKAILAGEKTADVTEVLAMAQRAYDTRRFALAVRFCAVAMEIAPRLAEDRQTQLPYSAACSAALAGCGQGVDDPPLDDDAKARLRGQALTWLQTELDAWTRLLESSTPDQRPVMTQTVSATLAHWQEDFDLAGVRGDAVATLPKAEQEPWRAFWKRVQTALAAARAS